ncbi:hypothetical protein GPX89_26705 [Nocardia sp. ET3-3]|uniref:Uncharacterized protein n=1 Tax=Nocardia terrae TaxID=2675851 RepID=A0A7K1V2S0_9NOCA|nr:hypothetical protein [Nocardia terrae]MVU80831.1 hypothetical protein [Nocardia terrae]
MNHPIPQPGPSWGDSIDAIRTLVQAQDLRAAKQQLRQLQTSADDATWAMIVEIANTLRFKTHPIAVTKLRKLWRDNEQYRPLIEACVPKAGEHQHIPEPAHPYPGIADEAPGNRSGKVDQRVDPNKRVDPSQRVRTPNTKVIDDYEKTLARDERDDPGTPRPKPITDRHDYDFDALTHVATTLCVSCRLERAAIDRHTDRVQAGRGDDGLCGECRSLGRLGLPELPPGHSLADQTHARLEFLAEHFPTQGRGIFRQEWRYADRHVRPIVSAWVKAHTNPAPEPEVIRQRNESTDLNGWCENCGDYRQLVPTHASSDRGKKLCFDCEPRYRSGINIEARHSMYAAGPARETQRSLAGISNPMSAKVAGNQEESRQSALLPSIGGQGVSDPAAEYRKRMVESAREKARAAAQERRRAMGRQSTGVSRTRSVRR